VVVTAELGLRERKKQQTRRLILESAARLFAKRGFELVTVAEIARAADVSEVTVFNYFPSKEDLVFGRMEFFEEKLISAVRGREPGESVLAAFQRSVLDGYKDLAMEETAERIVRAGALINSSPALQVREREISARYTQLLAQVVAEGTRMTPDDVELQAVAGALMSVHRAVVIHVRAQVLAGRRGPKLVSEARAHATRAFARLDGGLATYAIRRA
jgi:AcrR family transcriptional regulator